MKKESEPQCEKEKLLQRNLFTNFEETIKAIAKIEGQAWLEIQENKKLEQTIKKALLDRDKNIEIDEEKNPVAYEIYGRGGDNRWFVKKDGTVELSKLHVTGIDRKDVIKKAQELGFDMFD